MSISSRCRSSTPNTGREREVVTAFSVAYDNRDPQRAQQGAAWLIDAFLEENRNDRRGRQPARRSSSPAKPSACACTSASWKASSRSSRQNNVGKLPELNEMNLNSMDRTENEINNIESQMQALRRERVFLVSQLQQARSAGPETANLRALEDEYARKSVQYDQSHPDLIMLRRQIDRLRAGGSSAGMIAAASSCNSSAPSLPKRVSVTAKIIRTCKRISRNIEALEARIAAGESADLSGVSRFADGRAAADAVECHRHADGGLTGARDGAAHQAEWLGRPHERGAGSGARIPEVTRDLAGARAKYDELLKRQMDAEVSEAAIAGGTADKFRVKSSPKTPDEPAKPAAHRDLHHRARAGAGGRIHLDHLGAAARPDSARGTRYSGHSGGGAVDGSAGDQAFGPRCAQTRTACLRCYSRGRASSYSGRRSRQIHCLISHESTQMSIIEEAVRKTAERHNRHAPPPDQSANRPRLRRVPSAPDRHRPTCGAFSR